MARVCRKNGKSDFMRQSTLTLYFAYRENRYVLFLTENYAALEILKNPKNYLGEVLDSTNAQSADKQSSSNAQQPSDVQPFILFGSSFPKDKEYTQVSGL